MDDDSKREGELRISAIGTMTGMYRLGAADELLPPHIPRPGNDHTYKLGPISYDRFGCSAGRSKMAATYFRHHAKQVVGKGPFLLGISRARVT